MGIALPGSSDKNYHEDTIGSLYGEYQFLTLEDIVKTFVATYCGVGKICENIRTADVNFHAGRALQELSYDTFKSISSREITVPNTLQMAIPRDYVNYIKVSLIDQNGTERLLHPMDVSSNPLKALKDENGNDIYDGSGNLLYGSDSTTWNNFKSANTQAPVLRTADDDSEYFPELSADGERYGANTKYMQRNGWFYIDDARGKIHFSSALTGETVSLKYISDGMGAADSGGIPSGSALVHKFAEEAMYKHILYGCLSALANPPASLSEIKKQRFAETRKAKIRLSNIKLSELTQAMRGGSKWIKH